MGINDETIGRPAKAGFQSTQWSLVIAAQDHSGPEAREAFSKLCERYWYPLYAYVRQSEPDANRACDLTQGFFAKVIEKNYIADADPRRGRFRTFLLASLAHFMANERDKATAAKRGGGAIHLSIESAEAEQRYINEPANDETPEHLYERRWATTLLSQVLELLQAELVTQGKGRLFEELKQFLSPVEPDSYRLVAKRLDMTEGAVKVAVHRLRARYRERLRAEIADTIACPQEVEDEIQMLFQTFSNHSKH